eukprot:6465696-Prymnesium_polylepis.1
MNIVLRLLRHRLALLLPLLFGDLGHRLRVGLIRERLACRPLCGHLGLPLRLLSLGLQALSLLACVVTRHAVGVKHEVRGAALCHLRGGDTSVSLYRDVSLYR